MLIPDHLKIGAHHYRVLRRQMDGRCGERDFPNLTITIDEGLRGTPETQTLLHEAVHAMNGEMTEQFIDGFAEQLTQFLIDNQLCFCASHALVRK